MAMVHQTKAAEAQIRAVHERLRITEVRATRGPVSVRLNGLGELLDFKIEGESELSDLVLACLRAGIEDAKRHYERYFRD